MPGERSHRDLRNKPASTPKLDHKTPHDPEPFNPERAGVAEWQRMVGNQGLQQLIAQRRLPTTGGLIQAKLTVGAPDDQFEQQADRVAGEVMRMPEPATLEEEAGEAPVSVQGKRLQRQEAAGFEELEEAGPEGFERQEGGEMPEEELPGVQMRAAEEDEQTLRRAGAEDATPAVTENVEARIQSARGNGKPLAESARRFMEPRFGKDFSGVNVHTGPEADSLNHELGARAFTTGQDIFFSAGEYNPGSQASDELLAHELTHVVQQGGSVAQPGEAQQQINRAPQRIQRGITDVVKEAWQGLRNWLGGTQDEEQLAGDLKDGLDKAKTLCELGTLAISDPEATKRLETAAQKFGAVADSIGTALEIRGAARDVVHFVDAVNALDGMDIQKNPEEAAVAFGKLFASAGKLGERLPSGPWTAYFTWLSSSADFFTNMRSKIDPEVRWKQQFEQIEK